MIAQSFALALALLSAQVVAPVEATTPEVNYTNTAYVVESTSAPTPTPTSVPTPIVVKNEEAEEIWIYEYEWLCEQEETWRDCLNTL